MKPDNLLNNPVTYRLPWSRFIRGRGTAFEAAEVTATRFDESGKPILWGVIEGAACLNKEGEWEFQPQPSSRDDEWIDRCRYATKEEAAEAAYKHFTHVQLK